MHVSVATAGGSSKAQACITVLHRTLLQDNSHSPTIKVPTLCSSADMCRVCTCSVVTAGGASKAQACITVLHRTLLQDGFKVLETSGPAETIDLLARVTK
jgi:DNA-binding transcriptional regulator LsrR (DeoR family)